MFNLAHGFAFHLDTCMSAPLNHSFHKFCESISCLSANAGTLIMASFISDAVYFGHAVNVRKRADHVFQFADIIN